MFLVMNIGCLHCEVPSAVVGVFSQKSEADRIAVACGEKYEWREDGQNAFEVFELPPAEQIAADYDVK